VYRPRRFSPDREAVVETAVGRVAGDAGSMGHAPDAADVRATSHVPVMIVRRPPVNVPVVVDHECQHSDDDGAHSLHSNLRFR
jgi:hypothetical protein